MLSPSEFKKIGTDYLPIKTNPLKMDEYWTLKK